MREIKPKKIQDKNRSVHGARRRDFLAASAKLTALTLIGGSMALPLSSIAADNYPSKPIKIVLGFSAGGGTDAIARALAKHMGETLGVTVVVENKPGANGNLAGESVAKSVADGYTLLYNTSSVASSPALYGNRLSYSVLKDLKPVGRTASLPIILLVPSTSPFKTVNEFVAYSKANPMKLNYGSAGNGNVTHLAALTFESAVKIKGTHVPYKGEAQAIQDVMAGHIDYYFATSAGAIPAVKSGRAKALGVATMKRLPTLPDVPTFDETLVKGLDLSAWSGLMAPAGTPSAVVKKLNAALNKALQDKDVLSFFQTQSAEANVSTQEEYDAFLKKEIESLEKVIKEAGIKLD